MAAERESTPTATLTPQSSDGLIVELATVALTPRSSKQTQCSSKNDAGPSPAVMAGAGTVLRVGSAVRRFRPGDGVCVMLPPTAVFGASFESHVEVDSWCVVSKPTGMSANLAASLPVTFTMAVDAVHQALDGPASSEGAESEPASPTRALLVLGGSSLLGTLVIQLARHLFPGVAIFATCLPEHATEVFELGCLYVIEQEALNLGYHLGAAAAEYVPHGHIEAVVDTSGAESVRTDVIDLLGGRKRLVRVAARPLAISIPEDVHVGCLRIEDAHIINEEQAAKSSLQRLLDERIVRVPTFVSDDVFVQDEQRRAFERLAIEPISSNIVLHL